MGRQVSMVMHYGAPSPDASSGKVLSTLLPQIAFDGLHLKTSQATLHVPRLKQDEFITRSSQKAGSAQQAAGFKAET